MCKYRWYVSFLLNYMVICNRFSVIGSDNVINYCDVDGKYFKIYMIDCI